MARNKANKKQITQGGLRLVAPAQGAPDIFLQAPELFHFDLAKYMQSINAARQIDYSFRTQLYDMYESALLDLHLSGVLAKRLRGVTQIPIEFHRDGKADDVITPQLRSPWFKELRKEIVLSEFWGFSLLQFYTDEEGFIRFQSIDRKHYDPVHRLLLKHQGDINGRSIDEFEDMLFVGKERSLGIFAELMPAVLYKRGDMSDWARYCNLFGMPIREYTYDAGDEEARKRLIADARQQGTNAVYIHPKESTLNLIESGNKSGSSELYKTFADYWDGKISIRVLGNTLTTDAQATGTQALGTVHKEEEDEMNKDDRDTILDTLNYFMRPIFESLGFHVEGGEFVYAHKESIDIAQQTDVIIKLNALGLPIDDDYLYEYSGIPKPDNYDQIKAEKEEEKKALQAQLQQQPSEEDEKEDKEKKDDKKPAKSGLTQRLRSFFGLAPQRRGADNDF